MDKIDIIIPLYNEEKAVPQLMSRIREVFQVTHTEFNLIFIDDGSKDGTLRLLKETCEGFPLRTKIISFSRNFGHQSAVVSGLRNSNGHAAVIMDGDLQDPPELVFEMIEKWKAGARVVYAQRETRSGESVFKLFTADLFYRLLRLATNVDIPRNTGDFRLIDRIVIDRFNELPEHERFVRGLIPWLGFRQEPVTYVRGPRVAGETKYSVRKMFRLAINGIASFSTLPIRLCTYIGLSVIMLTGILLVKIVFDKFYHPEYVIQGWTSVMIAVLFFGGVQLMFLGILGEYVGKIYHEVKGRPDYIVDEVITFPGRS